MKRTAIEDTRICVIGLGYVGLPLARLFSTKYPTIGFDMNRQRVEALMAGHDATLEVSDELSASTVSAARRTWTRCATATSTWWPFRHRWTRTTVRT